MNSLTIDKCKMLGKIKPMHCTNNIPSFSNAKMLEMFKDAVPYARFHDTFLLAYHRFIDVSNIFPNFDADETDPASYDFAFTDALMQKMQELGVKPFYRLGESIENFHNIKAFNIYPPKNFCKWARICEHIIMHYNEGWANGMNMGIEYWEIWNEPDNYPDIKDNQMWKGTFKEYLKLYEISSNHLKTRFPNIKIGGYSSCGFYAILDNSFNENAKISSRTGYFIDCMNEFLSYISTPEHKSPLDFFSWHSYAGVKQNVEFALYARKILDKYGFKDTENILNEWNTDISVRGGVEDASNVISNMIEMHRAGMDMLMYYDARITSNYGGLFSPIGDYPKANSGKALPTYYVFKAFNELYRLGNEIEVSVTGEKLYALGATDNEKSAVIISNNSNEQKRLDLSAIKEIKVIKSITQTNILTKVDFNSKDYLLTPFETILIEV